MATFEAPLLFLALDLVFGTELAFPIELELLSATLSTSWVAAVLSIGATAR
jgi:hypothetical protein